MFIEPSPRVASDARAPPCNGLGPRGRRAYGPDLVRLGTAGGRGPLTLRGFRLGGQKALPRRNKKATSGIGGNDRNHPRTAYGSTSRGDGTYAIPEATPDATTMRM